MDFKLVEKAYNDGLAVASLIRNAANEKEAEIALEKVDEYCDFLYDNFGIENEDDTVEGESCYLAFDFYEGAEAKLRNVHYTNNALQGNYGIDTFIQQLYSGYWLYDKILYEFKKTKQNKEKAKSFIQNLNQFLETTTHLDDYQKENILKKIQS